MPLPKVLTVAAAALVLAAPAARASAELLPRPESIGAPEPMLREISQMLVGRQGDARARILRLDAMLAQLREPSQTRGLIQFLRALHLNQLGRGAEAIEAAEESVRLLPSYSGPLLLASQLEAYSDRPGAAADYLVRASEIDPEIVSQLPPYELHNVLRRLDAHHDTRRLGRLSERMIAINWRGSDIDLRSRLALEAIRSRVAASDLEAARALVPRLLAPGDLRMLLIDRRYMPLWPDLETWGGERQERLWPIYLSELRARFEASSDPEAAHRYALALRAANHHETIVRSLAPLFALPLHREQDYELVWVATFLADALARLGRWSEIEPMFARAAAVWPLGLDANAINVAGNRARFLLYGGDAEAAAAALDRVIADAAGRSGEVSAEAMATIHLHRACALHEAGRDHETVRSVGMVLFAGDPTLSAALHLCFDRPEAARAALIEGLADDVTRADVLAWVQRSDEPPMQSDYGRREAARERALREDPLLLRAIARYGRVVPYAASAGAPPER